MAKDSSLEKYELPGKTVTVSLPEIYNIIQYWLLNMYRMGGIIVEVAHRSIIKQGYLGDGSEGERKRWGHGRGVGGGGGVKYNWSFWWGTNNHWLRSKSQQQQRCGHRHTDRTTKWLRPPYAAPFKQRESMQRYRKWIGGYEQTSVKLFLALKIVTLFIDTQWNPLNMV